MGRPALFSIVLCLGAWPAAASADVGACPAAPISSPAAAEACGDDCGAEAELVLPRPNPDPVSLDNPVTLVGCEADGGLCALPEPPARDPLPHGPRCLEPGPWCSPAAPLAGSSVIDQLLATPVAREVASPPPAGTLPGPEAVPPFRLIRQRTVRPPTPPPRTFG